MRAFIIGNGPSLKRTPLDLLRGEVTFAMNRIHKIYDQTFWRPTYWVYTDIQDMRQEEWINDCLFHLGQKYHSFIWSNLTTMIELERGPWDYWKTNVTWIPLCRKHVSMDSASPKRPNAWHLPTLCKFGTSAAIALQLAVLKGFNPIYVVGMDLGFKPLGERQKTWEDPNHFTPDYGVWDMHCKDAICAGRKNNTHHHAHKMAKKYCDENGIQIYNATLGGELEVYERVDLQEVLNDRQV